jgi:hypothetical protein
MSETPQDKTLSEEEWRMLAEQAAHEQDPAKLIDIIKALSHALDEKDGRKRRSHTECDQQQKTSNPSQTACGGS